MLPLLIWIIPMEGCWIDQYQIFVLALERQHLMISRAHRRSGCLSLGEIKSTPVSWSQSAATVPVLTELTWAPFKPNQPPPPDLFFVLLDLYRYGVETGSICFECGILLMEISPDDVELIFRAKMLLQHWKKLKIPVIRILFNYYFIINSMCLKLCLP